VLAEVGVILNMSRTAAEQAVKSGLTRLRQSGPANVLLVEDEAILAMEMTHLVAELGHTITGVAMTQEQALEFARRDPPDLIILDIHLADGSSGIDAYRRIVEISDEIPVIFSTGFPDRLLADDTDRPVFVLTKPTSERQMRDAILSAVDVSRKFPDQWHQSVIGLDRFWPPSDPSRLIVSSGR